VSLQVQKIALSETVEVVVNNPNSRQYKFSDNETTLDQVIVTGISINTDALVRTFSGRTVMANAEMKKGYLTLSTPQSKYPIKRLPLETFFNNQNFILFFEDKLVDFRKSFIDFPNSGALVMPGDGLGFAVPITIYYKTKDGQPISAVGEMGEVYY